MREGENEGKGKFREELRETNVQAWDVVSSHHSHVTLAVAPAVPAVPSVYLGSHHVPWIPGSQSDLHQS